MKMLMEVFAKWSAMYIVIILICGADINREIGCERLCTSPTPEGQNLTYYDVLGLYQTHITRDSRVLPPTLEPTGRYSVQFITMKKSPRENESGNDKDSYHVKTHNMLV